MLTQRRLERATVLFVVLVVLSFVLTTIDVRSEGGGVGATARDAVQNVASPVQRLATAVTRPIVGFFDGISNIASLRSENERLREEIELLEQQAAQTEQLQARLEGHGFTGGLLQARGPVSGLEVEIHPQVPGA